MSQSQLPMPSGTVTFLFTDMERSTQRWEAHPTSMRAALAKHDAILRSAIESNGGHVFKTVGDAFCAAFSSPYDALSAALDLQRAFAKEEWPPEMGPVLVRAALHTGVVDEQGGDYFGQPLNRVARLLSAGHGAQTLLSMATQELVRDSLPPTVQLVDMGQHRLKDLTRPEHIFQLQAEGLPTEFPPLRTLDNRPNNLPEQLTPFIGREKEVGAVCSLLQDPDVRLVTLTGAGGTGKTRVALQVAAELLDEYPDGTWFVDLSPVTESALVVSRIAQTLGVREAGGAHIIDTLKSYLKGKSLLLVLDNFEQVLSASGIVTDILRATPGARVLVTSRMKLSVYGEHDYEVPPLSLPEAREGRMPPLEKLNQYEAVRLFIERAQAVKADFQVTNDNAPAVAEICVRLDGLPLAIELAAARIRMLPPNALLARLTERLRLLTGGSRDLPARHQTLRGAIGWSYDLLPDGEKQLFTRMAVFNGGRTIEALEEVCNYDGQLQVDVLDGVQSLIDESLLQEREVKNGEPRFWMLETIHEYAREKLKESGEGDTLRKKHASYFLAMADEAEAYLGGPAQQEWLDRLEEEHDDLRAALQWTKESEDSGAVEAGLRAVAALRSFWRLRGYYTEGRAYLRDLLAKAEQAPQPGESKESRAKALTLASNLASVDGDISAARPLAEEALKLARETGDSARIADALRNLGNIVWDPKEARVLHEKSLTIKREIGDKEGIAATLNSLAIATLASGDVEEARRLYEESLATWRELGNRAMVAWQLFNLGWLVNEQGEMDRGRALLEESMSMSEEVGDKDSACNARICLAHMVVEKGDYAGARSAYEDTLAIARELGFNNDMYQAFTGLANLASVEGDYATASRLYDEVAGLHREMGDEVRSLQFRGIAANHRGEYMEACALLDQALTMFADRHFAWGVFETLGELGQTFVGMGRVRKGIVLLGAVEALTSGLGRFCRCCTIPFALVSEKTRAAARAQLGEAEFEAAWQEGQALSVEETVVYARGAVPVAG